MRRVIHLTRHAAVRSRYLLISSLYHGYYARMRSTTESPQRENAAFIKNSVARSPEYVRMLMLSAKKHATARSIFGVSYPSLRVAPNKSSGRQTEATAVPVSPRCHPIRMRSPAVATTAMRLAVDTEPLLKALDRGDEPRIDGRTFLDNAVTSTQFDGIALLYTVLTAE